MNLNLLRGSTAATDDSFSGDASRSCGQIYSFREILIFILVLPANRSLSLQKMASRKQLYESGKNKDRRKKFSFG